MCHNYNQMAFTPDEVKKGLHLKLLNTLLEISNELKDSHLDIHITDDSYCLIIEWCDVYYDKSLGSGKFEFVGEDETVMKEVFFPDNHCEYLLPDEVDDRFKEWLDEQAKAGEIWEKTPYGTWTNKTENERWKKLIGEDDGDEGEVSDDQKVE